MAGKKKNIHVLPDGKGGWKVKREGTKRAGSIHPTQSDAIDVARDQAKRDQVELVIHGKDYKIRDKDSYGPDPCPPEDKKH